MKFFYPAILLIIVMFYARKVEAQVPTVQDCLGALSICQPVFSTPNTYLGSGNYPNEVDTGSCLMPGDFNSTWLTFTIQKSGLLEFVITPTDTGDYDFAVYNLTNATCADIQTNPSLSVSCNSVDTRPTNVTGLGPTGTTNFEGPVYGNPFNAPLPVQAGETYVINIENWTELPGGFTIDFSSSTADVFDSTAPGLRAIASTGCNLTSLSFSFSENILCSTIQDDDFTLTGPGGPYNLSGVSGVGCAAGGTMEKDFTIQVSPAISLAGNYQFNLTGADGYVTDLCGNVAKADSLLFTFNPVVLHIVSSDAPSCNKPNGSITAGASGGTSPYTYSLNGGIFQQADSFINLASGIYAIAVQDSARCLAAITDTLPLPPGRVIASAINVTPAICNGICTGSAFIIASGGDSVYTFHWPQGQTTASVSALCANTYIVTVTDNAGCNDTAEVTITEPSPITDNPVLKNISCNGENDGSISVNISGGSGTLNYNWTSLTGTGAEVSNLSAGTYKVVVSDQNNCTAGFQFQVTQPDSLVIAQSFPDSVCRDSLITLNASARGGTPPYTFTWDNGTFTGAAYPVSPGVPTTYTCIVTDANNCSSGPENFPVKISPLPVVIFAAPPFLCEGERWTLEAYYPNATFQWGDGNVGPQEVVDKSGFYYVYTTNDCGTTFDSITIVFNDCSTCVYFPNAFSPNDDGINDFFQGKYDCTFSSFNLQVYDRWGQLLYESNNPSDVGWDGNFNGRRCDAGTYVYVAKYSGIKSDRQISKVAKGNVTLLR